MNRQDIVERALLIALTQRDMSGCEEEHSLMSSVCKALDESSNQMSLSVKLSGLFCRHSQKNRCVVLLPRQWY